MIRSKFLRSSPDRVFESLYKRHVKDVYRYCGAILDRQADAEDATQTTFMNAYRALARGQRPREAGSWLRAVALNVCREHYRRAGRRPEEVSLDSDPGELVLDPPGPEIGDVVRGLSCLPFNQRAALVMREFEGRSLAEIAAALDVSASAVEALLFRARRSLREQLEAKLTCSEAEQAISRQLDGALPRRERGRLRAHLRECRDCAALARRVRAQRSAIRSLALLPLPASLRLGRLASGGAVSASAAASAPSIIPGGSLLAGVAGPPTAKLAMVAVAGVAALGVGYEALPGRPSHAASSPSRTALAGDRGVRAEQVQARAAHTRFVAMRRASAAHGRPGERPATGWRRLASTGARPDKQSVATSHTSATSHAHSDRHTHSAARAHGTGSSSSAASAVSERGHSAHGSAHDGATTPGAQANQKLPELGGNGHAFGRAKPSKLERQPQANHQRQSSAPSSGRPPSLGGDSRGRNRQ